MSIRGSIGSCIQHRSSRGCTRPQSPPWCTGPQSPATPSSGISVSLSQFFMSKSNVISLLPIVFIKQGKTAVTIIDLSSLPIAAEINLSLEGDSTSWP